MKARLGNREIEIDEGRVRGGARKSASCSRPDRGVTAMPVRVNPLQRPTDGRPVESNSAPSPSSPYRSKLEARYANYLAMLQIGEPVAEWHYEPCVLKLSDTARYRPDFLVVYRDDNRPVFVEVKGWSRNRRDGLTRLKWAAKKYWWWEFRLVEWVNGHWREVKQ